MTKVFDELDMDYGDREILLSASSDADFINKSINLVFDIGARTKEMAALSIRNNKLFKLEREKVKQSIRSSKKLKLIHCRSLILFIFFTYLLTCFFSSLHFSFQRYTAFELPLSVHQKPTVTAE